MQALTLPPAIAERPVELAGPDQAPEEKPDFSSSPRLGDERGYFGRAVQRLVIEKR
jgi:hypothetical protein